MDSKHKSRAWVGLGIGLPLFLGGSALILICVRGPMAATNLTSMLGVIAMVMLVVSIPFYLWGCAHLAKAKGYSSAILLTCILGWLFPVVILFALPDKNKYQRWK